MRRAFVVMLGLLAAVGLAFGSTAASSGGKDVLEFDVMAPVEEPFTGGAHPIRGVPGGGLPWEIDRGRGELRSDGRLDITVDGLVLARRAPVPPELQGTNPIPQFAAIVNCLTPASPDEGESIMTAPVPATA